MTEKNSTTNWTPIKICLKTTKDNLIVVGYIWKWQLILLSCFGIIHLTHLFKDFWDAQVILIIIYHLYLDLVTGSISYFVTVARFSLKHLQAKHVEPSLIDDTVDTVKWMMSEPWMVGGDTEGPGCIMQHWCDQQWGDFDTELL